MSMAFHKHRFKIAAFFYFIGFIQLIHYFTTRLFPTLTYLGFALSNPSSFILWLWEVTREIGTGFLFLVVAWIMTIIPTIQEEKPPVEQKTGKES